MKERIIICKTCSKDVPVTPRESHYITHCKPCYIKSKDILPTGICLIEDDDDRVGIPELPRIIRLRFKIRPS